MTKLEEARAELREVVEANGWACDCPENEAEYIRACVHRTECEQGVWHYADAYALAAHVDACMRTHDACHTCCPYDEECACDEFCQCVHPEGKADNVFSQACGDGWYCEKAEEIQELGR